MANYNRTILTSDNKAVIEHILSNSERTNLSEYPYYNGHKIRGGRDKDGNEISLKGGEPDYLEKYAWKHINEILIISKNEIFDKEGQAISKQFPKSKIFCEVAFEGDNYFEITNAEYLNGNTKIVGRKYCPRLIDQPEFSKKILGNKRYETATKRVMDFAKSLYDKEMITEGETITYTFVIDDFKIEANIPFGYLYGITIYKAKTKTETEWETVEELPF